MLSENESSDDDGAHIQQFIFVRELSEVYLLLDFISGRWDKSLFGGQSGQAERRDQNWIVSICEINWPVEGSKVQVAEQAAMLLRAKDRLNAAARPATGITVAFTLMVVGEDRSDTAWWRRLFRLRRPREANTPREPAHPANQRGGRPPTRISLARKAFPGLVTPALRFGSRMKMLVRILIVWLAVTCVLSWNVTAGSLLLARLDKAKAQRDEIASQIAAVEVGTKSRALQAGPMQVSDLAGEPPALLRLCDRAQMLVPAGSVHNPVLQRFNTVEEIHLCDALHEKERELASIGANVRAVRRPWTWSWPNSQQEPAAFSDPEKGSRDREQEEALRIFTQLMANSVLPFCYGILGAGAAVVRDLWAKMRESTLSPRDYPIALGQLALGAVVGACIGLFITPAGAPGQSDGLIASAALTASALSFIAGFGVEAVFVALEGLLRRIFNLPPVSERR